MKNIVLTLCCIGSFPLFAQNGIYLKPEIGLGTGNVFTNFDQGNHVSGIFSYSAQLGVGYQKNKWRIESGVRYFTTGYKSHMFWIEPLLSPNGSVLTGHPVGYDIYTFTHIAIPLSVGYKISLAKKWSLVPMIGVMVGYNLKYNIHTKSNLYDESKDHTTDAFEGDYKEYKRINVWGNVAVNIEYKAGKRLNIAAGVQSMCMLNSIYAKDWFYENKYYQYNYSATLNLGVKWDLGKLHNKVAAL